MAARSCHRLIRRISLTCLVGFPRLSQMTLAPAMTPSAWTQLWPSEAMVSISRVTERIAIQSLDSYGAARRQENQGLLLSLSGRLPTPPAGGNTDVCVSILLSQHMPEKLTYSVGSTEAVPQGATHHASDLPTALPRAATSLPRMVSGDGVARPPLRKRKRSHNLSYRDQSATPCRKPIEERTDCRQIGANHRLLASHISGFLNSPPT